MIRDVHPGTGSRIRILIFYLSRIHDPWVKKTPDPRSGSVFGLQIIKKYVRSDLTCLKELHLSSEVSKRLEVTACVKRIFA
jgi:hypothetical protein